MREREREKGGEGERGRERGGGREGGRGRNDEGLKSRIEKTKRRGVKKCDQEVRKYWAEMRANVQFNKIVPRRSLHVVRRYLLQGL